MAESDAAHPLDSGMYHAYAVHMHHKSKIAALGKVAAILASKISR